MAIVRVLLDPNAEPNPADLAALDSVASEKLTGIEDGAKDDQTGEEIKAVYEVVEGAYSPTKDEKLAGIAEGAKDDQTGEEIRDAVVALPDPDRKIVVTNPQTGEQKIIAVQGTPNDKIAFDKEDVPE